MDIKEKRRQYYINNRDRILQLNKQYYYEQRSRRSAAPRTARLTPMAIG